MLLARTNRVEDVEAVQLEDKIGRDVGDGSAGHGTLFPLTLRAIPRAARAQLVTVKQGLYY